MIATGSGAPNLKLENVAMVRLNAERAAKLDAHRNILETLKGLRVSSAVSGKDRLSNGQLRTRVEGLMRGCKTVDTRYYNDGGVDVVLKCPLQGELGAALLPKAKPKKVPSSGAKKYSGLIIDATGLKVRPALGPTVVHESGEGIYGPGMVSPTFLNSQGVATYVRTMADAKRVDRVGASPLVIKASSLGASGSELRVSAAETKKLANQNLGFLAEARVVIVTDGP